MKRLLGAIALVERHGSSSSTPLRLEPEPGIAAVVQLHNAYESLVSSGMPD
ncbi:MAG TPA: hypothetical protein VFO14_23050 [Vicinamibacterales bacterium]|nr:hypothetical protein [Vicinamibacterales bacterium]